MIKTFNGDVKPESLAQLERAAAGRDDIHVIDRFLPVEQKDALLARADAYVSLHRSEGFGLSLAEAMLLGKPAIATGYSGNLQFMTPANSWLAGYELVRVGEGVEMYPPDARWAEPDLDHAAELMREVRAGGDAVAAARRARAPRRRGRVLARGDRRGDARAAGADRRHRAGGGAGARRCARRRCRTCATSTPTTAARAARAWPRPPAARRCARSGPTRSTSATSTGAC